MLRCSIAILAVALLAACADRSAESNRIALRDSSGVRIVDLPSVSMIEAEVGVSDTPAYRIGAEEGGHVFEDVVAGGLWPDGRAVVGDGRGTLQVVMLSPTGEIDAILGRPGDGPGELRSIFAVLPLGGDTVVVQDPQVRRATVFSGGEAIRTIPLDTASVVRLLGTDAAGDFLMGPPQSQVWGRQYETPWLRVPLLRLSASTGAINILAWADWDQIISGSGGGDNPFMSGGFAAAADGGFVTGRGDRPELRWYDAQGQLRQIARWRDQPQPVPDDIIAAWEHRTRAGMIRFGLPQADIDARISGMKTRIQEPVPFFGMPGPMPDFGGLISDPEGNIWIAAYQARGSDSPRRYYLMSPEGVWLGWADMPRGLRVLAIGADRVLGVERDTLDVQSVSVYGIRKPAKR